MEDAAQLYKEIYTEYEIKFIKQAETVLRNETEKKRKNDVLL